jgi:hypothetical protein
MAEVEQVAAVDDRVDLLLRDDRAHQRVLVRTVDVGHEQQPRRHRLLDVALDVLLLEGLGHGEQVAEVRRHLGGARLDVGEQPGVALHDTEHAGGPERGEPARLVRGRDARERDHARDDHRARNDRDVSPPGLTLPDVVGGQSEGERRDGSPDEEAHADTQARLRDRGGDLVTGGLQRPDVDVLAREEVHDLLAHCELDIDAGSDERRGELHVDVADDRRCVQLGRMPRQRVQAQHRPVLGCLDHGRHEVRRRDAAEVADDEQRQPRDDVAAAAQPWAGGDQPGLGHQGVVLRETHRAPP